MNFFVVGDAFIDLIVPFGPCKSGETYHRKIITSYGGTANVVFNMASQGMECSFVGCVGADPMGKLFRSYLQQKGIGQFIFEDKENPTGLCISLLEYNGERTMIANRGANDSFEYLNWPNILDEIIRSQQILVSGYSLISDRNYAVMKNVIEKCHAHKCNIFFNPGASNIINDRIIDVIDKYVDILILNYDEARILSKSDNISIISQVLSNMGKTAVVTLGKDGCMICHNGETDFIGTDFVKAIDTTGAGDAFTAGFIIGYLSKKDLIECGRMGNQMAKRLLIKKNGFYL